MGWLVAPCIIGYFVVGTLMSRVAFHETFQAQKRLGYINDDESHAVGCMVFFLWPLFLPFYLMSVGNKEDS